MRRRHTPLPRTARRIVYDRAGMGPPAETDAIAGSEGRRRPARPREIPRAARARWLRKNWAAGQP